MSINREMQFLARAQRAEREVGHLQSHNSMLVQRVSNLLVQNAKQSQELYHLKKEMDLIRDLYRESVRRSEELWQELVETRRSQRRDPSDLG